MTDQPKKMDKKEFARTLESHPKTFQALGPGTYKRAKPSIGRDEETSASKELTSEEMRELRTALPLSTTHPTLWKIIGEVCREDSSPRRIWEDRVQSCTVDVAQHERLQKEYDIMERAFTQTADEVERLKKELINEKAKNGGIAISCFDNGFEEGERRIKQEVKRVLEERFELWKPSGASENRATAIIVQEQLYEVYKKLGLGDEGKR